jgi:hypothetical protein
MERVLRDFKPKTYDVNKQLKAIEAFEAQAVKSAEETKGVVDRELGDLQKTLTNIEEARPFEDLTVVCGDNRFTRLALRDSACGLVLIGFWLIWALSQDEVAAAQQDIDKRTEQLVSKGKWQVPGYKVHSQQELVKNAALSILTFPPFTGALWRSRRAISFQL